MSQMRKIAKPGAAGSGGYGLCPLHGNKLFRVDGQGRIWVWCKACRAEHEVKIVEEPESRLCAGDRA